MNKLFLLVCYALLSFKNVHTSQPSIYEAHQISENYWDEIFKELGVEPINFIEQETVNQDTAIRSVENINQVQKKKKKRLGQKKSSKAYTSGYQAKTPFVKVIRHTIETIQKTLKDLDTNRKKENLEIQARQKEKPALLCWQGDCRNSNHTKAFKKITTLSSHLTERSTVFTLSKNLACYYCDTKTRYRKISSLIAHLGKDHSERYKELIDRLNSEEKQQ